MSHVLKLTFIFITSEEEEKVEEERVKSQADQVKVKSVIELAGSFSPLFLMPVLKQKYGAKRDPLLRWALDQERR